MSTIKANVVENTSGGATTLTDLYPSKAWVNLNGTGTMSIRDDGNVSSITDNGAGRYTSNFSNNISTASYATTLQTTEYTVDSNATLKAEIRGSYNTGANGRSTSSIRFGTTNGYSYYDMAEVICVIAG